MAQIVPITENVDPILLGLAKNMATKMENGAAPFRRAIVTDSGQIIFQKLGDKVRALISSFGYVVSLPSPVIYPDSGYQPYNYFFNKSTPNGEPAYGSYLSGAYLKFTQSGELGTWDSVPRGSSRSISSTLWSGDVGGEESLLSEITSTVSNLGDETDFFGYVGENIITLVPPVLNAGTSSALLYTMASSSFSETTVSQTYSDSAELILAIKPPGGSGRLISIASMNSFSVGNYDSQFTGNIEMNYLVRPQVVISGGGVPVVLYIDVSARMSFMSSGVNSDYLSIPLNVSVATARISVGGEPSISLGLENTVNGEVVSEVFYPGTYGSDVYGGIASPTRAGVQVLANTPSIPISIAAGVGGKYVAFVFTEIDGTDWVIAIQRSGTLDRIEIGAHYGPDFYGAALCTDERIYFGVDGGISVFSLVGGAKYEMGAEVAAFTASPPDKAPVFVYQPGTGRAFLYGEESLLLIPRNGMAHAYVDHDPVGVRLNKAQ